MKDAAKAASFIFLLTNGRERCYLIDRRYIGFRYNGGRKGEMHMGTTALTEAVFYILLSLDQPLHGYGIMQNVERLSGGRVRLAAGTLYGALATLTERGWIVSLGDEGEGRKKEYCITPAGREAVRTELRRLHELTQNGDALTSGWK